MKNIIKNIIPAAAVVLTMGLASCDSLHVDPIDPNLVTEPTAEELFNKCYANMALAGQTGPDGDSDVDGIDGGTSGWVRQYWNANELTTDEAICGWGDAGISGYDFNQYDSDHPMLKGLYYRLYTGIAFCNQYLEKFSDHDATMTAEVRFLRALDYYELLDMFGNVGFVDHVGANKVQWTRKQLYDWIDKEVNEIEPSLSEARPKSSSDPLYGRVDKASAWMLLARLYLNAQVYTGTPQWQKALQEAQNVINSSYKLYTTSKTDPDGQTWSAYQQLFMGDNGESGAYVEGILPIKQDGQTTASYGVTLFLMAGAQNTNGIIKKNGQTGNNTSENWGGNRCRSSLLAKFFPNNDAPAVSAYVMPSRAKDDRAIFDGQAPRTLTNDNTSDFQSGYETMKFINWKTDGSAGHHSKFPDTDFFLFRVGEAYLIAAEADARINGGQTSATGTSYINALRARAHAQTHNAAYSLDEICDEWSREMYFEGVRRPTLIRFNRFGGDNNYTWPWKGGAFAGTRFAATRNIFAIPTSDLNVSKGALKQNPGY